MCNFSCRVYNPNIKSLLQSVLNEDNLEYAKKFHMVFEKIELLTKRSSGTFLEIPARSVILNWLTGIERQILVKTKFA